MNIDTSVPIPPAPTHVLYQLYALSFLCQEQNSSQKTSTDTCHTLTTSLPSNASSSVNNIDASSSSIAKSDKKQKKSSVSSQSYCCIYAFILILTFMLITIFIFFLSSNLAIRFTLCKCPAGYEKSLSSAIVCNCVDKNECLSGAGFHTCTGLHMQCINTMGSYKCRCRPGFTHEKSSDSCVDIDECDLYRPCNTSISTCVNLPGQYYCQCVANRIENDQCIPKNICAEKNDLCGPYSECIPSSTDGYTCQVSFRNYFQQRNDS